MGEVGAARVVEVRPADGYSDLNGFCHRSRLPRRLIENLILAGGMDHWGCDRRQLIWELGRLHYEEEELPLPPLPDEVALDPMDYGETLVNEYLVTGVSANGHLLELFRERLKAATGVITSQELQRAKKGKKVRIAGLVAVRQAPPTAKNFVFITLEDETGLANLILAPDVASQHRWALDKPLLIAEGLVEKEGSAVNVKVGKLTPFGWSATPAAWPQGWPGTRGG